MNRLILTTIFVFFAGMVHANEEQMLKHIEFIEEHTDYVYNDETLPEVIWLTDHELMSITHPQATAKCEMSGETWEECRRTLPEVAGAYNKGRLWLNSSLDYLDQDYEQVMFHEMVHFMQEINTGLPEQNPAEIDQCLFLEAELEAYGLGRDYAEAQGYKGQVQYPAFWLAIWKSECDPRYTYP